MSVPIIISLFSSVLFFFRRASESNDLSSHGDKSKHWLPAEYSIFLKKISMFTLVLFNISNILKVLQVLQTKLSEVSAQRESRSVERSPLTSNSVL